MLIGDVLGHDVWLRSLHDFPCLVLDNEKIVYGSLCQGASDISCQLLSFI